MSEEQVKIWRRSTTSGRLHLKRAMKDSWDMTPSTRLSRMTSSQNGVLKDMARFLPLWKNEISSEIKSGKKVLIVAHGNSLRALVKYLDNIPDDEIVGLNIPTGIPLVYELNDDLKLIKLIIWVIRKKSQRHSRQLRIRGKQSNITQHKKKLLR